MKSFKLIIIVTFSFVFRNQISYSQSKNTKDSEQYMPTEVASKTSKRAGYSKKKQESC